MILFILLLARAEETKTITIEFEPVTIVGEKKSRKKPYQILTNTNIESLILRYDFNDRPLLIE